MTLKSSASNKEICYGIIQGSTLEPPTHSFTNYSQLHLQISSYQDIKFPLLGIRETRVIAASAGCGKAAASDR